MRNKERLILILIICSSMIFGCSQPDEVSVVEIKESAPVLTADIVKMTFEDEFLSIGTFEASDVIKVYTGGEGDVERIMVSPGDKITAGQVLFTLDKSSFENSYKATESQLRTLKESAEIEYEQALKAFEKNSILYESGGISRDELDASRIRLKKGKQSYQDAVTNYNSQVSTLKDALDDRMVTAPISGIVGVVYINENETVSDSLAVEIVNDDQMFVIAMVTDTVLAYINEGDSVLIHPDGETGETIAGLVKNYNIVADEKTGLYDVKILVLEPVLSTRTGSYAEVTFIMKERESLAVLRKSVVKRGGQEYIFVVEDDRAYRKNVVIGTTYQQYVEIVSGLKGDEVIIIQGQELLEDGESVVVQEYNN